MKHRTKLIIAAILAAVAIGGGAALYALPRGASAGQGGQLDDGKGLLPQAGITLEQAITAAQATGEGAIGEVDLEHWNGTLVFNVDAGDKDVKVDAATGTVLDASSDD